MNNVVNIDNNNSNNTNTLLDKPADNIVNNNSAFRANSTTYNLTYK